MTLYGYDIASAYPFAMAQLPCLRPEHGRWVAAAQESMRLQIVHPVATLVSYCIAPDRKDLAWGPIPFRDEKGNILFPTSCEGGWSWLQEFQAARWIHPGVYALKYWTWKSKCVCPPPFRDTIAQLFNRRLLMGKNSQGLTVKLALNSGYGVSAQSAGGGGRYRCMVRAGLITSMTRAMLLRAVAAAGDPWNVLELATDSILSRVPLKLEEPADLGTHELAERLGKSPLGAWEEKKVAGMFLLRPGLRFELDAEGNPVDKTEDDKPVAARGVGTRVLYENRAAVLRKWRADPLVDVRVQQPSQFHGSKQQVRRLGKAPAYRYERGDDYGTWLTPKPRLLSYSAGPKRDGVSVGVGGSYRLHPHESVKGRSAMYTRGNEPERDGLYELFYDDLQSESV
jgi:hypothetical protein